MRRQMSRLICSTQYGEIFRVRILNQGMTFLIGNDAHSLFFETSDKVLTQKEVYKFTVPGRRTPALTPHIAHSFSVFGKNIVYDAPPSVMVQQLKFVRQGLTGHAMQVCWFVGCCVRCVLSMMTGARRQDSARDE